MLALRDQLSWAIIDVITRTGDCLCTRPLCCMGPIPATSLENEQVTAAKKKCLTEFLKTISRACRLTFLDVISLSRAS